jgi:hypothetical protein
VEWLEIISGTSGSGNGSVSYTVSANTSCSSRSVLMNVAGKSFTVTQDGTGAYILPDTGQIKFYNNSAAISKPAPGDDFYGQDANYNPAARQHSYTKLDSNGNDLPFTAPVWYQVRDNLTGLIWEVKNSKDGVKDYNNPRDADNSYTWYDSNSDTNGGDPGTPGNGTDTEDFINDLNSINSGAGYCGETGWRLPTVQELSSLVDAGLVKPSINSDYFHYVLSSSYWSSTADNTNDTDIAWVVNFRSGYVFSFNKSNSYYVRAVRSGQSGLLTPLIINQNDPNIEGDDTVTDPNTGLMWQRYEGGAMSWQEALTYCEGLTLAGYKDWRLPDCNELQSLINYDHELYSLVLDSCYFPQGFTAYYWSSTTEVGNTSNAWLFGFGGGDSKKYDKLDNNYVRAVRSGQSGSLTHSAISVTPTALDFGPHPVGGSQPLTLTVSNSGDGALALCYITLGCTGAADFSLGSNPCAGSTVAPGASCLMTVTFAPTTLGSKTATLTINSNDSTTPSLTVALVGEGSCGYTITPTSHSFSSAGGSGTISVTSPGGCSWSASESENWLEITSGDSGSGNGSVAYRVSGNTSSSGRSASINVAGKNFTVNQDGVENFDVVYVCGAQDCNCSGNFPCFETIDAGYAAVNDNGTIKVSSDFYLGDLIFADPVTVILSGGWNSSYSSNAVTFSAVAGSITISQGCLVVEGLSIGGTTSLVMVK